MIVHSMLEVDQQIWNTYEPEEEEPAAEAELGGQWPTAYRCIAIHIHVGCASLWSMSVVFREAFSG